MSCFAYSLRDLGRDNASYSGYSEDLNALVKRHLQTIVSSIPSKALATLEHDASDLIASGMVTLNAKLSGVEEDKLIHRIVEIWGFFWDQVLPYVEGVCHSHVFPLQFSG